jgi:dTDP-glucose pyrophosphorylase
MTILMPMAGAGQRFAEAGYKQPKPFITVNGRPMFLEALAALPPAEKHIFISRERLEGQPLPPASAVIYIDAVTEGQAATCLLAKHLVDNDEPLLIAACDNGLQYNMERFYQMTEEADCLLFSFRHHTTVLEKPEQYGWIRTNGTVVTGMSVKKPISTTPLEDHAVTGAFWFRKGTMFVQAAEAMMAANRRINNEFYVDECITDVLAAGLRVKVFEVDKYICWGTPNDLQTYLYWQSFFKQPLL